MRKVITAVTCIGIALTFKLQGQDMKIPLGTMPMIYNGGFAGEGEHPRINTGGYYSSMWGYSKINDYGYIVSYDQFVRALRTGIGFTFRQDHYNYRLDPDYYDEHQTQLILS